MDLSTLYTLTGTAVVEQLGTVQDGERIKVEFRGRSATDSPIEGKAHALSWIFIGPLGPGDTSAVQEILTPAGERLVVELHGYTRTVDRDGMEIRASGIIRSSAARFAGLDGRVALVVQQVLPDHAVHIHAYAF